MNEYSKNVVRRRHIGKNHTTLGPEYFFRTSAPARIFRPRPAVSGGIFGRDLGPEKIFSRPRVVLYNPMSTSRLVFYDKILFVIFFADLGISF